MISGWPTGVSIMLISSELPEILALSDRVLVMHEGRVKADAGSAAGATPGDHNGAAVFGPGQQEGP